MQTLSATMQIAQIENIEINIANMEMTSGENIVIVLRLM